MKTAKCCHKYGDWIYYRTEDGHTFSVRDNKHYFYHGNVFKNEKTESVYIEPKDYAELFENIKFEY
jgi:hypothetical protein